MKKDKNIVKYRKPLNINIGVIIFIIIFIYLLFNVYSYLTVTHISFCEVEQGTIAVNNVYNGLILRSEKLYNADYSGAVNYYVKEGSKVCYGDLVCSIDENGDVAKMINEANQDASNMDADSLTEIEKSINDFQNSYQSKDFYNVYTFKDDVNAALSEALSVNALNNISDYVANAEGNNTFHKLISDTSGIVTYFTDGFENITADNFTSEMFDASTYSKISLKSNMQVTAGSTAYKLIDSEYWNIIVPVSADTAVSLADDSTIKIRFLKDDKEMYVTYTLLEKGGQNYLNLSLKSAMVRYATDRYVEIELLLSEESGLKIPNSAITEKEFYLIPNDYFLKGGDSNNEGILVNRVDDKGNKTTEFVSPTIYYENETMYYIDSEDVSAGEVLVKPDSSEVYVVGTDMDQLKGVYNINKGYAVFKQINILYQNEEYSIVKTGTTYGISLYDHIALDGTKINENDLIK